MARYQYRIYQVAILFNLIGLLLIGRLFVLQIIDCDHLSKGSLSMRRQDVPLEVMRGEIVDCNGLPLTNITQQFMLVLFPSQIPNKEATALQIATLLGLPSESFVRQLSVADQPFKVGSRLEINEEKKHTLASLPGCIVTGERARYRSNALAAHIIGYMNPIDNEGVSGIEGMYDELLSGRQFEYATAFVDGREHVIPGLGYKRLRPLGTTETSNIVVTLDRQIQTMVEEVMDRQIVAGAVIVLRPSSGEILAMASRPNFDPNHVETVLAEPAAPLLNRALNAYQPGSVFKLVTAAAALENKVADSEDVFFDSGYIDVNTIRFNGWDHEQGGRGRITFTDALAYSSNPVFIEIGLKIGAEKLLSCAQKFGFGHKTALAFSGEAAGNLPAAAAIFPGELANLAIGQGELEATPLQIASLVATIANDGVKFDPYLISKITNSKGLIIKNRPVTAGERVISSQTALKLQRMMSAVTRYGTGQAANVEPGGAAGKTGSAETGRINHAGLGISHAWFAGYAPLNHPEYVVVVVVEEGMSGGDVAAPIFHEIVTKLRMH